LEVLVKNSYILSHITYKKALEHDCFNDIISRDEADKTVIIAFLPFSTSNNEILCVIQKFDKIHLLKNGLKNFYITRIIFHQTITEDNFIKWEKTSKLRYQDIKFRKSLFYEIQKDLENNHYSVLKDSDFAELNIEFFNKELPLIKFKFINFED
jgi:hypothetical protein